MPRQTNFSAGELDPLLWGRTELPAYARGLRRMRNFFPTKHGAAMSRPGTTFVAGTKFVDAPSLGPDRDGGQARLLRFDAGDALHESYVLEFGNQYIRFLTDGAQVLDGGFNVYEIASPYTNTEIWELQTAQLGDVVIICSPAHPPQQLRRNGHADWTLEDVSFKTFEPSPTVVGDPTNAVSDFCVEKPTAWQALTHYSVGNVVSNNGNCYECTSSPTGGSVSAGAGGPTTQAVDIVDGGLKWQFICVENFPDASHPAAEWQWMYTAIVQDKVTGVKYETVGVLVSEELSTGAHRPLSTDKWAIYPDRPVILRCSTVAVYRDGGDTYEILEYLMYRGRGGAFGWIGSTKSIEFIDLGEEPDYAIQPPAGTAPFDATTGYPRAVAFYDTRLVFAGPTAAGGDVEASKVNDFRNWDVRSYKHIATEAVHFQVASKRREDVRSLAASGRLVLLSSSTAWSASFEAPPQEGLPVSFDPRSIEDIGATTLPPLVIEGAILYARAKGRGVRALIPAQTESGYSGVDISNLAQHLFTGADCDLVDWTYQEDPFGVIWAVRADGTLLSLTFTRDHWGWARHDMKHLDNDTEQDVIVNGTVESVCAVPEGDEDAVYLVVVRETATGKHRYIERMTSRVKYGGAVVDADGVVSRPPDFICLDSALQYFGDAVQILAGLEHLEGKTVYVLSQDSDPLGPFTVREGTITLDDELPANIDTVFGPKALAYVGLYFEPELESLDVAGGDERLRKKIVERVGFEADQSIGLRVGQDFEHLDEWIQRDVADGYGAVSSATVLVDMPVEGTWDQSARAALRQAMPLPITVVGLTRKLALGD